MCEKHLFMVSMIFDPCEDNVQSGQSAHDLRRNDHEWTNSGNQ